MNTEKYLQSAGCKPSLIPFLKPYFEECFEKYSINTPVRITAFLAQLSHESGSFFYTAEIASGQAYEGRTDLGNFNKGDGKKYKGRGFIQITGRANYTAVARDLGIDCINKPELLGAKNINLCTSEQMRNATLTAGWFWNRAKLNNLADRMDLSKSIKYVTNSVPFEVITRKINGGTNGLQDRKTKFERIRLAFV